MLHLSKFIHTPTGKLIMSIIFGFGLASFFRKVCKEYRYKLDKITYDIHTYNFKNIRG